MKSGNRMDRPKTQLDIGARDHRILDDVIRFHLVTNESIEKAHLPDAKANATVKVTGRLVTNGWLKSCEFVGRRKYFIAGARLIQQFGLPASRGRPLGPQALATQLCLLDHCVSSQPRLRLLNDGEFTAIFGAASKAQRALPHAIDPDTSSGSLRILRVDLGGSPAHVAKKLANDMKIRESNQVYATKIATRSLILVVLTTTVAKKAFIEIAIRNRTWPNGLRFSVVVAPCLSTLLGLSK